mgnify:FL=1
MHDSAILARLTAAVGETVFQRIVSRGLGQGVRVRVCIFGNLDNLAKYGIQPGTVIGPEASGCVSLEFLGASPHDRGVRALASPETIGFLQLQDAPACPNGIIEAQAYGLPVIGGTGGAIEELTVVKGLLLDPYYADNISFCEALAQRIVWAALKRWDVSSVIQGQSEYFFGVRGFRLYEHELERMVTPSKG